MPAENSKSKVEELLLKPPTGKLPKHQAAALDLERGTRQNPPLEDAHNSDQNGPMTNGASKAPVRGVGGEIPLRREKVRPLVWQVEKGLRRNCRRLGRCLALLRPDLYRNGTGGQGLRLVLPDGATRLITTAAQLAPVLVDTLAISVTKNGKCVADMH